VEVTDDVPLGGGNFDGLNRAKELADEAGDLAGGLPAGAAVIFDAFGGGVGDDAYHNDRGQGHERYRNVDLHHQDDRYDDDEDAHHDVVNQDHEQRDLNHVVAEAADRFAGGIRQGGGARPAQDIPEQVAAQEHGHLGKDGHVGVDKAIAAYRASHECGEDEGQDGPDIDAGARFAADHVEESLHDQRGDDLPHAAHQQDREEIHHPIPGAEADHMVNHLPGG